METMNQNQFNQELKQEKEAMVKNSASRSNNLTVKGLIVFIMVLLLQIPMLFIHSLVNERRYRESEVQEEVSSKWAGSQLVSGPIVMIPYKKDKIKNKAGEVIDYEKSSIYILPEELSINGKVEPHTRHRSIFDVTVYQADLNFSGFFQPVDWKTLNVSLSDLYLNEAQVFFGLSDFRGIEEQLKIKWNDKEYELISGSSFFTKMNGLVANIELTPDDLNTKQEFSMQLNVKGSNTLMFTPIGKTNHTQIFSPWTNPSFTGNFLPNNPADITESGFQANWKILYLNRNYPQIWKDRTYSLYDSEYGVKLLQSTDSYAKTERSVKYAILFVSLTFALYFFIEILQKRRVHPLQYILVGLALCIFYTLLLSFSEYINFNFAYLIAAAATVILIALYTASAFRKWTIGGAFGLVLGALYSFIFVLIQLQDRALLFGSIGLFVLLAIAMYSSRKIDWYQRNDVK